MWPHIIGAPIIRSRGCCEIGLPLSELNEIWFPLSERNQKAQKESFAAGKGAAPRAKGPVRGGALI